MKKIIITSLIFTFLALSIFSQTPQAFKYQTVVRNSAGEIISGQDVGIRISIHDLTAGGTIIYQETFNKPTNQFGLLNLEIGKESPTIGNFTAIDWSSGSKFIETEIDPNGGTTYVSMGTSELLAVPYSLFSDRSSLVSNKGSANIFVGEDVAPGNTGNANAFVGYQSGFSNTSGYVNTFMGNYSGYSNLTGAGNTFIGNQSGYYNTSGALNTIIGDRSGIEITEGNRNTYLGYKSGFNNQTGSSNICIGYKAGYYETGSNKLHIHNEATASPLIYGEFDNRLIGIYGRLGIGHTEPDAGLHVKGETWPESWIYIESTEGTTAGIRFIDESIPKWHITDNGSLNGFQIGKYNSPITAIFINQTTEAVGIGTTNLAVGYQLSVDGKLACEEVLVEYSEGWPDFVFTESYDLPSLENLETQIKQNNHLPGIPSAKEIEENGFHLAEMQKNVLQKVEELTLYTIEQGKLIKELQDRIEELEQKNLELTDNQ